MEEKAGEKLKEKLMYDAERLLARIKHIELTEDLIIKKDTDYLDSALIHCEHIIRTANEIHQDLRKIKRC